MAALTSMSGHRESQATAAPQFQFSWWSLLPIVFVAFYLLTIPLEAWIGGFLPEHPADVHTPPWWFIERDVARGIALALAFLASLVVALLFWQANRRAAFTLIWMSAMWTFGTIAKAVVILFVCDSFFDPGAATCPWPNHDAYLHDPWLLSATFVPLVLIGVGAVTLGRKFDLRQTSTGV